MLKKLILNQNTFFSHQRLQQVRMVNPNLVQGNQISPRMSLSQNRPNIMQNIQQPLVPNVQSIQSPILNQTIIGHQAQQQISQQQQNSAPPPPYPEPPPPYPGQAQVRIRNLFMFLMILCEFLKSISKNNIENTN